MKNKFMIPVIITLVGWIIHGAWAASKLSEKVEVNERHISSIEVSLECIPTIKERLARIEEGQKYQIDLLREVRTEVRRK